MKEEWRAIENWATYEVSNLGRVRNIKNGKILKGSILNSGYIRVSLSDKKRRKRYFIHRLVALAFIEKFNRSYWVDHINEIKTDNRLCNLKKCTPRENAQFFYKNRGKCKGFVGVAKRGSKFIAHKRINNKLYHIGMFYTPNEAQDAYNNFTI